MQSHGLVDGVELVVAGQLLADRRPVDLEDDEVPDQVQEPAAGRRRPVISTSSCGVASAPTSTPSIVRQGMNRSQSAVSVPTRASRPSETTSISL